MWPCVPLQTDNYKREGGGEGAARPGGMPMPMVSARDEEDSYEPLASIRSRRLYGRIETAAKQNATRGQKKTVVRTNQRTRAPARFALLFCFFMRFLLPLLVVPLFASLSSTRTASPSARGRGRAASAAPLTWPPQTTLPFHHRTRAASGPARKTASPAPRSPARGGRRRRAPGWVVGVLAG